jgi:hypothetical protein
MKAGLTARQVAEMIHAHPTLPEAMMEAIARNPGQADSLPGR